jgi:hypothetical protein
VLITGDGDFANLLNVLISKCLTRLLLLCSYLYISFSTGRRYIVTLVHNSVATRTFIEVSCFFSPSLSLSSPISSRSLTALFQSASEAIGWRALLWQRAGVHYDTQHDTRVGGAQLAAQVRAASVSFPSSSSSSSHRPRTTYTRAELERLTIARYHKLKSERPEVRDVVHKEIFWNDWPRHPVREKGRRRRERERKS